MHILIVGGAGYIGSVLCRHLLSQGHYIRVLDKLLYGSAGIDGMVAMYHPAFQFVEGDTRDQQILNRVMHGIEAVVHLGEIVGDPACSVEPDLTESINLVGTFNVAAIAKQRKVKQFIYISSCSVYGANDDLATEDSPFNPLSLYATMKVKAEQIINCLRDDQFQPNILRLATVYGDSLRPRFDLALNCMAAFAANDHEIYVNGGNQWRPFVHVTDVARAIALLLGKDIHGATLNVGSDEQNCTILELAQIVAAAIGGTEIMQRADADNRNYRVSFARIAGLGFQPYWTLMLGATEVANAIRDRGIQYDQSIYSNYRHLSMAVAHKLIDPVLA